jgi:hypothetical protein
MVYRYSVALPPPPAEPVVRQGHVYSEFVLDLPPAWQPQAHEGDNTLTFHEPAADAVLIVSVDFIDSGATDLAALGNEVLSRRLAALASATPGAWQTLQQQVRPHGSEAGLELSFAAELPGEQVALYLGYATPRKLLHFLMLCGPDRAAAIALFNATVPHFKPRLP